MVLVRLLAVAFAGLSLSCLADDAKRPGIGADKYRSEKTMRILKVNMIVHLSEKAVETDRDGILECSDSYMRSDLAFYFKHRFPVSIEFDISTRRITSVSSAPTDILVSLSPADGQEGPVAVSLLKRPTMLYLSRSHVRFKPLYALLQRALKEKKIVAVGTLPGDMEVEDVRIIGDE